MAMLMQNQALFLTHLSETRKEFADMKKELDLIKALLIRHEEMLQKLPEAIREKIGDGRNAAPMDHNRTRR